MGDNMTDKTLKVDPRDRDFLAKIRRLLGDKHLATESVQSRVAPETPDLIVSGNVNISFRDSTSGHETSEEVEMKGKSKLDKKKLRSLLEEHKKTPC